MHMDPYSKSNFYKEFLSYNCITYNLFYNIPHTLQLLHNNLVKPRARARNLNSQNIKVNCFMSTSIVALIFQMYLTGIYSLPATVMTQYIPPSYKTHTEQMCVMECLHMHGGHNVMGMIWSLVAGNWYIHLQQISYN
jgi:hypothetical protein